MCVDLTGWDQRGAGQLSRIGGRDLLPMGWPEDPTLACTARRLQFPWVHRINARPMAYAFVGVHPSSYHRHYAPARIALTPSPWTLGWRERLTDLGSLA